jgi:bacillithiol biosynthesis cysteine-adding enzyme BshC
MDFISTRLPYRQTGVFPSLALDYIDQAEGVRSFFSHAPSLQGIREAIKNRKSSPVERETLVTILEKQYEDTGTTEAVKRNIRALASPNTFTITTAHQNNLFTGPLYFIYKIIHAIRLAEHLGSSIPEFDFVPVFYMGTEDADLEELNHIHLGNEKLAWPTKQKGAVGRMKIDQSLVQLIDRLEGELLVLPFGKELVAALRESYRVGQTIQEATFRFVNFLFAEQGLVVLLPDHPGFKAQAVSIFQDDLLNQSASDIVDETIGRLEQGNYKVQANPREINLFYLENDRRERIEMTKNGAEPSWRVMNTGHTFTRQELVSELQTFPERFSPNVILRGIYQETILPNIVFIGGSGELAYWLQFRNLFTHYRVPFPVLVLRNSYLVVERKWREKIAKLGFTVEDFFLPAEEILNRHVLKLRGHDLKLNGSLTEIERLYDLFKKQAAAVDPSLETHVDALRSQAMDRLLELEKKMVRAEKRKFSDQRRQILAVKEKLFPGNGLQERWENLCYYYAKWGRGFLRSLYENAGCLEQEFCVLQEK